MTEWILKQPGIALVRHRTVSASYVVHEISHVMLRFSIAGVFILFGALKITGHSPVAGLLEATFPWANHTALMVGLGSVEVLLGVALLIRKLAPLALLMAAGHLCGTFVTFLLVPSLMMQHGNPLLLTTDGEFVAKNVILISAAILLASAMLRPEPEPQRAS
jgi:putative oxidoreductase